MAVKIRAPPAMRAGTAAHSRNSIPDIINRLIEQSIMKHLPLSLFSLLLLFRSVPLLPSPARTPPLSFSSLFLLSRLLSASHR